MTNKEILQAIIDKIKQEMKRQNLSQEDLANLCTKKIKEKDPHAKGISQSSISNILKKPSSATLSNLLKICDGLDLSLFAIFRSINMIYPIRHSKDILLNRKCIFIFFLQKATMLMN